MADEIDEIGRLAKRQGWHYELSRNSHWKFYNKEGRMVAVAPKTPSDHRSMKNFKAHLKNAGFLFEIPKLVKEMPTVNDLIRVNGEGTSFTEADKFAHTRKTRTSRAGMEKDILAVLKGAYPNEVDFTTLKMKVSLNHPGVNSTSIHQRLVMLKASGKVSNLNKGYYRATSADIALDSPVVESPQEVQMDPVLPGEAKLVIDNLKLAVEGANKLIIRLTRQLSEQEEATARIKALAARL
jgi:hypothetical protein